MWTHALKTRKANTCEHEHTESREIYGLQHSLCVDCGNVSVIYLYDFIEKTRGETQEEDTDA